MEPLYLVDGSGYIFRAYFAVAPLSTSKGQPTNALLGFTRMLVKLLRDVNARNIAVTFDTGSPNFRHELFDDYKANREECPADLVPQMPYFRKIVEALGIQSLEKVGFEADDIIGTLAKTISKTHPEQKIVIVSGDKDLTQLVNENIEVWDAMRDIHYTEKVVEEKFGVPPDKIVEFLALTGDSSDNVPGVKGVGPKTAAVLIQHFGNVENLLAKMDEIETIKGVRGAAGIRAKIESDVETLRLSRKLVDLKTDVEPFLHVTSPEEYHWAKPKAELLVPLFEELEFHKLLEKIPFVDQDEVEKNRSSQQGAGGKQYNVVYKNNVKEFVDKLSKQKHFAVDTETTSLSILDCELVGISFSWQPNEAWYIPLCGANPQGSFVSKEELQTLLNPILSNEQVPKYGVNLKYDINVLVQHGFTISGPYFDSMLASYVLNPDRRGHGLKAMALTHLKEQMKTYEETLEGKKTIDEVDVERVTHYAGDDAEVSFRLVPIFEKLLGEKTEETKASLWTAFNYIEMPLVPVLADMERVGFKIDLTFLQKLSDDFTKELLALEKKIYSLAGSEFNIRSTQQLSKVLFEDLGLSTDGLKKTKSGISTDASVLEKLERDHEIIPLIVDYRELFKLQSTYVEAFQKIVHPKTKRIHSSFNQAIAATGRLSSSEPNLQNIPIKTARGRLIRNVFISEEGHSLISADYSQIELRVLAHMSQDKNLQTAFVHGEDIHERTAKEIFGALLTPEELKEYRRVAKTINFGVIYGISAFRLGNQLGISRKQAQEYIDNYFARYPKVKGYFAEVSENAQKNGYVETLFGHRRYLQDIDTTGRDAGYALRSSLNAPLQGTAAEIIKRAMVMLYSELQQYEGKARIILQVHDELVIEVQDALIDEVKQKVIEQMEGAVTLSVPLKVDVSVAKNWGEA